MNNPVEGYSNLYEWCVNKLGHGPMRISRACTDKFKARRIEKYIKRPATLNLGIAFDEKHRAENIKDKKDVFYRFPLIEKHITREGCKSIIRGAGLPVPVKSGCWFCPFQPKASWYRLGRKYPELFWRAVALDEMGEKVGLFREPGKLRTLYPPQSVFEEDDGWECGVGCLLNRRGG